VVTSDRGQCGGYNANVLKAPGAEELLREQGKRRPVRHRAQGRELLPVRKRPGGCVLDRVLRAARYADAKTPPDALVRPSWPAARHAADGPGEDGVWC